MLKSAMFWEILDSIILIIEWIGLYIIINILSSSNKSRRIRHIRFFLVFLTAFTLNIFNVLPNERVIISIILGLIFYKTNYDVGLSKGIIVSLAYWMILLGIDALSISAILATNHISDMTVLLVGNIYRLEAIFLAKTVLVSLILLFKYFRLPGEISKKDCLRISIPLGTNILTLLMLFEYGLDGIHSNQSYIVKLLIMSLLIVLSNISLVMIIVKAVRDNKLRLEYELIKEKMSMEYEYYLRIEENQDRVRQLYHDMKNHMICIGNLCDTDDAKSYVKNLNLEISKLDNDFNTGNRVLDIIFNEKQYICKKNNINFTLHANFSKLEFIEMSDICTIFSNSIDNAIQACKKIKDYNIEKKISVRVTYVNSFCVIKINNTKINEVIERNNKIITDKEDSFLHGMGIINIKNTVKKYNGELLIDHDDTYFEMKIMIPIVKNNPVMSN